MQKAETKTIEKKEVNGKKQGNEGNSKAWEIYRHPEKIPNSVTKFYETINNTTEEVIAKTKNNKKTKEKIRKLLSRYATKQVMELLSNEFNNPEGLKIERFLTKDQEPLDFVPKYSWSEHDTLDVEIKNYKGELFFKQKNIIYPLNWSPTAVQIASNKYFYGKQGTHTDKNIEEYMRETSITEIIHRVALQITLWGIQYKYFKTLQDARNFYTELSYVLFNQYGAFNSPVWFNAGTPEKKQMHACFILDVEDDMESILNFTVKEGLIFRNGSGSGVNVSKLRAEGEPLSGGGSASGPISFMSGWDKMANAIKSGGKTRRSAKMVIMDVDHPDIMKFIRVKAEEEKKARALIEKGYSAGMDGEAYTTVSFQNSNHSVRVTDEFMKKAINNEPWETKYRTTGQTAWKKNAHEILEEIAKATWECGDPGIQFHDTTNKWNTCKNSGEIRASNPCSEYLFFENTACNLSSINLVKFVKKTSNGIFFAKKEFEQTVKILTIAKEIITEGADYPLKEVERQAKKYRSLGIGYTNLGSLLMSLGLPYDSEEARTLASLITSMMTATAYHTSTVLAEKKKPFEKYKKNKEPMLEVINMHFKEHLKLKEKIGRLEKHSMRTIDSKPKHGDNKKNSGKQLTWTTPQLLGLMKELFENGEKKWEQTITNGEKHGFRNAQVSLLAPTGTISFIMDADTTGVEPELALVKYKKMADGSVMKIVNRSVGEALKTLGYKENEVREIINYVHKNGYIEGAPYLKEEHLPVFDTAFPSGKNKRSIHYMGHLKMLGAVQPFISGGISKTINMPQESTPEDIKNVYIKAWELGIKNVAIYRDGSKATQVLTTKNNDEENKKQKSTSVEEAMEKIASELEKRMGTYGRQLASTIKEVIENGNGKTQFPQLKNKDPVELLEKIHNSVTNMLNTQTPSKTPNNNDNGQYQKPSLDRAVNTNSNTVIIHGKPVKIYSNGVNWFGRKRLPPTRKALNHKFTINGHEGYISVGMYPDGTIGEVFVTISKEGSTISGLMDTIATMLSIMFQYGIPLEKIVKKFVNTKFEPAGYTDNPDIRTTTSIIDYLMRFLAINYLDKETCKAMGIYKTEWKLENIDNGNPNSGVESIENEVNKILQELEMNKNKPNNTSPQTKEIDNNAPSNMSENNSMSYTGVEKTITEQVKNTIHTVGDEILDYVSTKETTTSINTYGDGLISPNTNVFDDDAPLCPSCGNITVRSGTCYTCPVCGSTTGCS